MKTSVSLLAAFVVVVLVTAPVQADLLLYYGLDNASTTNQGSAGAIVGSWSGGADLRRRRAARYGRRFFHQQRRPAYQH